MNFSKKQLLSYQQSNAKINIWEGAVRSGKTYISLWRFIKELTYGKAGEYALICRTYDSFKRNVMPQFSRMIGTDAKHYSGKREMHLWGKTVHIIGADDERAEAKIRGPTFMGAYVDEASIIPESVWMMLKSRCAMGESRIFATTNPDSPFHWLKKEIDENPDVVSWQFRLDDNPELSKDDKDYLRRQYKGLWYQRFIEGMWVQAEGSIYDTFDETVHVIDYPRSVAKRYIVGVDYGTANNCAFVLVGINKDAIGAKFWVEKEYYYNSKVAQRQKTDSEYATDLIEFVKDKPVEAIYIDPSALSFKIELRSRHGFSNLYEAKNEVLDGIRYVADMLNNGDLKVCRAAANLLKEFQSYVWDAKSMKTGIDKPLKENDHALDALRYALFTHLFQKPTGSVDWDREWETFSRAGDSTLPTFFR